MTFHFWLVTTGRGATARGEYARPSCQPLVMGDDLHGWNDSSGASIGYFNHNSVCRFVPHLCGRPFRDDPASTKPPRSAVCAVIYSSGLVYLRGRTLSMATGRRNTEGGGPYVTEIDSSSFDWAWRNDNLAFLPGTLSVDYVIRKLDQAAETFLDGPKAALAGEWPTTQNTNGRHRDSYWRPAREFVSAST